MLALEAMAIDGRRGPCCSGNRCDRNWRKEGGNTRRSLVSYYGSTRSLCHVGTKSIAKAENPAKLYWYKTSRCVFTILSLNSSRANFVEFFFLCCSHKGRSQQRNCINKMSVVNKLLLTSNAIAARVNNWLARSNACAQLQAYCQLFLHARARDQVLIRYGRYVLTSCV